MNKNNFNYKYIYIYSSHRVLKTYAYRSVYNKINNYAMVQIYRYIDQFIEDRQIDVQYMFMNIQIRY